MPQATIPFGREAPRQPSFRSLSTNERGILRLLQRHSPMSRAELARRTGLALPTVSRLCDQLLRDALVEAEAKVMMSSRGQPSMPVSLRADGAFAFGVALRAEELSVVLVDVTGQARRVRTEPITAPSLPFVIDRLAKLTVDLAAGAGIAPQRVAGIGVALPGFFVGDPPFVNAPLGMEDWAIAELEGTLGAALGLPVSIENDGSAAAVGERIYGAGRDHDSFAYVYVDRGLGGGIVENGALRRGRHGNAGEFTGLVPPDQRRSRPTLALLLQYAQDSGADCQTIAEFLAIVDPDADYVDRWLDSVARTTQLIVSAIASIVDPSAIILGGRLPTDIARRLTDKISFYSVPVRQKDRPFPRLLASELKDDAAALGAAALVFDRFLL